MTPPGLRMTKTGTTMTLVNDAPNVSANAVKFGAMEDSGRLHALLLDRKVWEDFGKPHIITVTIEPGDTLNADVLEGPDENYG